MQKTKCYEAKAASIRFNFLTHSPMRKLTSLACSSRGRMFSGVRASLKPSSPKPGIFGGALRTVGDCAANARIPPVTESEVSCRGVDGRVVCLDGPKGE